MCFGNYCNSICRNFCLIVTLNFNLWFNNFVIYFNIDKDLNILSFWLVSQWTSKFMTMCIYTYMHVYIYLMYFNDNMHIFTQVLMLFLGTTGMEIFVI